MVAVPAVRMTQGVITRSSMVNVVSRPAVAHAFSVRNFAADAKSETFLPVSEVTERVLNVVKNFEKIDPAKVSFS
jgi:hypothetical protein